MKETERKDANEIAAELLKQVHRASIASKPGELIGDEKDREEYQRLKREYEREESKGKN